VIRIVASLLLAILSAPALSEPWDRADLALGGVAVSALVVDWGQTRYIAKHPERYRETNPILGDHPSVGRVNAYFAGSILATALIADWFRPMNRKLFLGAVAAVEIAVTNRNRSLGVKLSF
jgi:hypothetical protein